MFFGVLASEIAILELHGIFKDLKRISVGS